ncbi:MAG: aldehyde ferredoxin oxidoreductase family protein [Firmicutes bacterium]|nr:aldehyde ferredoxin oxidoreductase family protein [Bacillota bacterium]
MRSPYGNVLTIDLPAQEISSSPLDESRVNAYLGGRGLNSRLLYEMTKGGEDPLGPDNPLIFGAGLLTGSVVPCSSRFTVTTRSPLTGAIGDGNSGGFFGPEMRFAGYSHIVFSGKAPSPVYVYVEDDRVEIRDASHLWGLDTAETTSRIQIEIGDPDVQVACIGPAGENLVKVSCIINNLSRAVARSGVGAVMGSKNLKAVAVRGSGSLRTASPEAAFKMLDRVKELKVSDMSFSLFSKYGTPGLVSVYNSRGVLPVNNFQRSYVPDIEPLSGDTFINEHSVKAKGCYNCVIHCSHFYRVEGSHAEEGMEYESIGALGPRLGVMDFPTVLKANLACNRLGLDTIGAGDAIGFLMECRERGLVSESEVDGLDVTWGNGVVVLELLDQMARRKGVGNLLAEGSFNAAKEIGRGAERYAMCVKGQAMITADPRGLMGWGLAFAVANRGADHLRAHPVVEYCFTPERALELWGTTKAVDRTATEGKGRMIKWCEDARAIVDSIGVCKFLTRTAYLQPSQLATLIEPATGLKFTETCLMKAGERITNLERLYNTREGFGRSQDTLPDRFLREPIPEGPSAGMVIPLDVMLDEYYEARGWDVSKGIPTKEKLAELGLA